MSKVHFTNNKIKIHLIKLLMAKLRKTVFSVCHVKLLTITNFPMYKIHFRTCTGLCLIFTSILSFFVIVLITLLLKGDSIQVLNGNFVANEVGGLLYSESCFIPTSKIQENICAPQFIIAGTMKGGTTSLFTYLQHHPLVLPLNQTDVTIAGKTKQFTISAMGDKETRFFNKQIYNQVLNELSYKRVMDTYLSFFPKISSTNKEHPNYKEGFITGEASPTYLVRQS